MSANVCTTHQKLEKKWPNRKWNLGAPDTNIMKHTQVQLFGSIKNPPTFNEKPRQRFYFLQRIKNIVKPRKDFLPSFRCLESTGSYQFFQYVWLSGIQLQQPENAETTIIEPCSDCVFDILVLSPPCRANASPPFCCLPHFLKPVFGWLLLGPRLRQLRSVMTGLVKSFS